MCPCNYLLALLLLVGTSVSDSVRFDQWPHQLVALQNASIHFRYAGTGPPILLVHGFPEHSITWDTIGPILAQNYTVIAVDNRGCGDSSLALDGNYTAAMAGEDLYGVLSFLNISQTYLVSHDKGVGVSAAFTANHRGMVKRVSFIEYALPGFGIYEAAQTPSRAWTLRQNWQLAFFSLPDIAEFFISGREKQMLAWYIYHASYAGNSALSEDKLNRYTTTISKPGFLRAGLEYFAAEYDDAAFFNSTLKSNPLQMPVLAMGGEASFGDISLLKQAWGSVATNVSYDVVPKAGHWIGFENPVWVANRILRFITPDEGIPSVDLSYLADMVTLPQQLTMGATLGG